MGGVDREAGVVEAGQRHQRVVVIALAADLVAVGDRGLVAMVTVGDQQLRIGKQRGNFFVQLRQAPDPGHRAGSVGCFPPGLFDRGLLGNHRPGVDCAQREDRREVAARRPHQFEPVLLGAGQGALVGQDRAAVEVLNPDADEDAVADVGAAVGPGVFLLHRPDRRLGVLDQRTGLLPGLDRVSRGGVGIALTLRLGPGLAVGLGQVDRDRVVGRLREQLLPHRRVDHVIGRRDHVLQRPDCVEVVVQGVEGQHLGHRLRKLHWTLRGVAQPGSAPPLGGGGPRFESGRPD